MSIWNRQPDAAPGGYIIQPGAPVSAPYTAPTVPEVSADHPPDLPLWEWGEGDTFTLADATTGVAVFGATGSGKTSGPARMLALSYLASGFGGLVLCAKPEERRQWEEWAEAAGRWDRATQTGDLVIFDKRALHRFNFLDWEARRAGDGGGFTINVLALFQEIMSALNRGKDAGGEDGGFWKDALEQMMAATVDLVLLAGERIEPALLRDVVRSAPVTPEEASSTQWQATSRLWQLATKAQERQAAAGDEEAQADLGECIAYWLDDFPKLSEKTRSIIVLSFTSFLRLFTSQPLRQLFSTTTNLQPEDMFSGNVIIVDLPVQLFRQVGRVAALVMKYCAQIAILRRSQPTTPGLYLRPVFLWADEAQNFMSDFDPEFQAVARSAGGCTVYLAQNVNQYRRLLGNDDNFEAFIGNLQTKVFCQNTSETNSWASELLGKRWMQVKNRSTNFGGGQQPGSATSGGGTSTSVQLMALVEPNAFTTLRRGGPANGFIVEAVAFKGGQVFNASGENYRRLEIDQR